MTAVPGLLMEKRDSFVRTEWCGEERTFHLKLGPLRAVQEATGYGPQHLYRRLSQGEWMVDEVREILRQGLIGGGMNIAEVDRLLRINFDPHPVMQHLVFAEAVMTAVLVGVANEPPEQTTADDGSAGSKKKRKTTRSGGSRSARSTSTPRKSDSAPETSTS